jgi:hypothetical protein
MALIVSNPLSLGTESSISSHTGLRSPEMPKRLPERWCIGESYVPVGQGRSHKWLESPIRNTPIRFFEEDQDDSDESER